MGGYGLELVTPPGEEPVSLAEAKLWLRQDHGDDDPRIVALIASARGHLERAYARQLMTATWRLRLADFPEFELRLPLGPVQAVSSVSYVAADGTTQVVSAADYEVSSGRAPSYLVPAWGKVWPSARRGPSAVTVTFTAGYGAAPESVPERLRTAVKLLAAHWFVNPVAVELTLPGAEFVAIPLGVEALMTADWDGVY